MAVTTETAKPTNFRPIRGTRLFRSSEPEDGATSAFFRSAGICTIIDLRDPATAILENLPDFRFCQVKAPSTPEGELQLKPVNKNGGKTQTTNRSGVYAGVHASIAVINKLRLIQEVALWKTIIIIIAFFIDKIFGADLSNRLTFHWVLNKDGDQSMLWSYKHMVDVHKTPFLTALRLLVDPSHVPAVIMCLLGKDRTGILCMLIGHICGHTEDQLIDDYAQSEEMIKKRPDNKLIPKLRNAKAHRIYELSPRDTMRSLLDHIKARYGSLDSYLEHIGFGTDYQEKLRRNILLKN